ncbi:unnamed protein product [Pleuronectes platessa]|uniref:Uncharacterized protein n=1 Tax=Pleuronectes platessa TaxID=8262 RepID=A0A9N7UK79_PLEPL|nr:unnamed protein product [Pleuronectes platessa]
MAPGERKRSSALGPHASETQTQRGGSCVYPKSRGFLPVARKHKELLSRNTPGGLLGNPSAHRERPEPGFWIDHGHCNMTAVSCALALQMSEEKWSLSVLSHGPAERAGREDQRPDGELLLGDEDPADGGTWRQSRHHQLHIR